MDLMVVKANIDIEMNKLAAFEGAIDYCMICIDEGWLLLPWSHLLIATLHETCLIALRLTMLVMLCAMEYHR